MCVYLAVSTAVTSASPAQQLWIVGPCGVGWVGSESEQDQTFKTQQTFKYVKTMARHVLDFIVSNETWRLFILS